MRIDARRTIGRGGLAALLFLVAVAARGQTPPDPPPAEPAAAAPAAAPAEATPPATPAAAPAQEPAPAPAAAPAPAPEAAKAGAPQEKAGDERAKQIEELRKQISDLNRRLDELSKAESAAADAAAAVAIPEGTLKRLTWRPIGPASMGGRITAIAVAAGDPATFYVATASGGLLKTENGGTTFRHLFEKEATVSIGDVAVAPSDKSIVWVGTGEANPRNSVSWGDGVYRSTDGGKTWTNMGLKESYQIGRIVIHPKDPNTVYVGALGRLWGSNAERGLFKTTDGGKSWEKVLFVDENTGVVDVAMDPSNPDVLLAATYERKRGLYDDNDPSVKHGPGSGLHRTTDGGKTWTRITQGLPTGKLGRIGFDFYRKDPKVVFAVVESEAIGSGPPGAASTGYAGIRGGEEQDRALVAEVVADGPAAKAGLQAGDVVIEADGKPISNYEAFSDLLREKKPGDKVALKVKRGDKEQAIELTLGERPARGGGGGGQQPRDPKKPFLDFLGGQRENVQSRQGAEGFQYGGVYRSGDGGVTWERINSLNPRPMYFSQVRVDPSDEQKVYVLGIQLYRSKDGGKSFRPDAGRNVHADHHALWIDPNDGRRALLGCDGGVYATADGFETWDHLNHSAIGQFYDVAIDSRRFYRAFGGLQDNGTWGGPTRTTSRTGPVNEDWLEIFGGDGFGAQVDPDDPDLVYFTAQNGSIGRRNLHTGEVAMFQPQPPKDVTYRWNWNTPFVLSTHNGKIYYTAGNLVFRSLDEGRGMKPISPEITRTDKGSATALAESPRNPDVLYVGTDDGYLWITRDGGRQWTEISARVGLPKPMQVASIEASRFIEGRVYVAFDGHRSDLDGPYAFASEDFGQTWRSLHETLPAKGSTRVLREDVANPDLLLAGTEFGAFASIDRGRSWTSLNSNLPTVAVHEFAIHRDLDVGEVVAATHGRSLWVLDASPLRQLTADVLKAPAHLFRPAAAERGHADPTRGGTNRRFAGENPPEGAAIYYHLSAKADAVSLKIFDAAGELSRQLPASGEPGLHRVVWDLAQQRARRERGREGEGNAQAPGGGGQASPSGEGTEGPMTLDQLALIRPRQAPPGSYKVVLTVGEKDYVQTIRIDADPRAPAGGVAAEGSLDAEALEELMEEEERGGIDD